MKSRLKLFFALIFLSSCCTRTIQSPTSSEALKFEVWQKMFIDKIEEERAALKNDSLKWWADKAYKNLVLSIKLDSNGYFNTRHSTALLKLGNIPKNASTFFVEFYFEGEVPIVYYGMFWIKGNQYKGVWHGEELEWHSMATKVGYLKMLINFRTDLYHKELIYSGGGEIFITEFHGDTIKKVNFVAIPSLPQYLITQKVFQ